MLKQLKHFLNKNLNNQKLNKFVVASTLLVIGALYLALNWKFAGPAYLSDEIGYLTKAVTFAGYTTDAATSWYGGYSLIISPIFRVFSDPLVAWKAVLVLNAAMWTATFAFLFFLLKSVFPRKKEWKILVAVVVSALYPSWVAMSGYAFSTTAFVFVFMLSLVFLLKSNLTNKLYLALYALTTGYLFWIHPTGIAVVASAALFFVVKSLLEKKYLKYVPYVLLLVVAVLAYRFVVDPWLLRSMTPEGLESVTHYKKLSDVFSSMNTKSISKIAVIFLGQLSYLLVTTFGVIVYAITRPFQKLNKNNYLTTLKKIFSSGPSLVILLTAVSLAGVLLVGSVSFGLDVKPLRVDHWIYGRYSEVVILPLLGVGLLTVWRFKYAMRSALIVLASGLILNVAATEVNTKYFDNNLVNIQSFWPQAIFTKPNYFVWFFLGFVAILLVGFVASRLSKTWLILPILVLAVLSFQNQQQWHGDILSEYSKPSGLYTFIINNYSAEECIGFGYDERPEVPAGNHVVNDEKIDMYSYYLYNYDFKRMEPVEWYQECDGPYLTYDSTDTVDLLGAQVLGREVSTKLYLIVKKDKIVDLDNKNPGFNFYINKNDEECVIIECPF